MSEEISEVSWDILKTQGPQIIADSLTSKRVPALQKLRGILSQSDSDFSTKEKETIQALALAVLKTYNYYPDSVSRTEALRVLETYVKTDRKYLDVFVKYIHDIASKSTNLALTDILTLVSWTSKFALMTLDLDVLEKVFAQIIQVQVFLLHSCADGSAIEGHKHKLLHRKRAFQASWSQTKQTLIATLLGDSSKAKNVLDFYVKSVISMKEPTSAVLLFLGVLADALHDLQPTEPSLFDHLATSTELNKLVMDYFTNHVVLSKVPSASYALSTFTTIYVTNFVGNEAFCSAVLPALEKAIMRSSEVGFCHLTLPIFGSKSIIDISSEFASSKLLTHILNGIKSTKENVREKAYETLVAILTNSLPNVLVADTIKITEEILKTLKATANTDSKILLAKSIKHLPVSNGDVAAKSLLSILPLTAKELNENILTPMVDLLTSVYLHLLKENWKVDGSDKIEAQFKSGLENAKLPLRRVWATEIGQVLYSNTKFAQNDLVIAFFSAIYPSLLKSLDEATKSPLLTVTNKGISCAYVCIVLSKLFEKSLSIDTQKVFIAPLADSDDKFSILVSPKVISKLVGADQQWCLRSLIASFENASDSFTTDSFGIAYLYFTISSNVSYSTRIEAQLGLKHLLEIDGERASQTLISGIQSIVHSEASDSDLNYCLKHLAPVFNSLTQVSDKALATKNLLALVTFAHHPAIAVKEKWIGLALRASIDPHQIIEDHMDEIIDNLSNELNNTGSSTDSYNAACEAFSTLGFVNPEVTAPVFSDFLEKQLDVESLRVIDSTAIQIWKAQEGELVVDVLNSRPKKAEDKNSKDYETRKWEESLKKEIAHKNKGVSKKLTKEEQNIVNEQLGKESGIRLEVEATVKKFNRGFHVIRQLTSGQDRVLNSHENKWFLVAVVKMLDALKLPVCSELFGDFGSSTFITASNVLTSRLGVLKEITGVAILRVNEVDSIPDNFASIPLLNLLSRVLFRIKILADDYFDFTSFIYILPLIIKVLEIGKDVAIKNSKKQVVTSEFSDEDPEEENLSLAIDIISSQAMLEDESIPRKLILEVLISLMKIPTKAKMAKECFLTVCQQISVNVVHDDLTLLMKNLVIPDTFVKHAILQGLDSEFDLTDEMNYSDEIWITIHDNDDNIAELSRTIWDDNDFSLVPDAPKRLFKFVSDEDAGMRLTIAKSIVAAVTTLEESDSNILDSTLGLLLTLFYEMEVPAPPQLDKFGLAINSHAAPKDEWEARSTVALTLKLLGPHFQTEENITKVFQFLVERETLGDKEDLVSQELLDAGVEIIKTHGLNYVENLIPIFEKCLAQKDNGSKKQDRIRELVIILYGSLGRHLDASDERLTIIVDRLLATLDTPSEDVQYAVSECIAPLVKSIEPKLQDHLDGLFEKLWNGKNLAIRKGAAYGIAGLVKGAGIKSLFANDVMRNITYAADDKKNEHLREGVSFVLDCLSQSLGPYFEPYVIEVLPIILKSLGDPSALVREATDMAAKQIMKSTTSYGVKKLIPLAISNLDDIAWRSKKGSVELLGSMAYLDPTQLSASLSTIVPEIVGVLNDSHKEVRKAADQALKRFGEVIRNPEIQAIVPDLIKAIGDPTKYTDDALDKLIKTQFVHYIDGPSLALIIHVIHRGMRERSALTKKKACQIVGNMAILVDRKDLLPYLTALVGELEVAMVDPVPATRSTAARALGSLVEKLGEEQFPDLIPKLLATLNDLSKAGDRLGSAQALAEVICGLGLSKLDEMLPNILSSAQSMYSHVRAGFMPLLLYLPVCFGSQFAPYLSSIIPPILSGLADTDEEIRETALRAGRLIVKNYANKAIDLLLPELEAGLSDSSYRIRLSSVELTGDLLFQVTGISGKNELTEEQVEVNKSLVVVLGQERRDRILAALFVCRSDVTSVVRAAAIDIWKALVANTPRTVKEIIPALTQIIVRRLASSDETHRTIAAATLGEVVRRVGANALAQLLPTLEESLISSDTDAKLGICIALTELINSATEDALLKYQDIFIKIIREALVDPSPAVREAAAQAFEALQEKLGKVVIDEVLPPLLNMLESDDSENALLALQDIMAKKSDVIFPILIPTLLAPPIDVFKMKALSSLASVAGSALYGRLGSIINTALQAVIDAKSASQEEQEEVNGAFDKILLSIDNDAGVHPVMSQLMSLIKHQDPVKRAAVCERLGVFFANTSLDYSVYVQDIVSQFILSLGDSDANVVKGVFEALSSLIKAQDKQALEKLVKPAHQALSISGVKGEELPGFALPKGPSCILPVFSHGLMYGSSDQKELSALSIADIIERTPAANLKPFATTITGPLIRVIGERVSSDIKSAILSALTNLLLKIPQFLRPFIPQLQRTFVRSLSDPSNEKLRNGAVNALGVLIEFQPRVDSLVTELVASAKSADDQAIKNTMLKAMLQVIVKGGKNMSVASKSAIMTMVEDEISTVSDKSAVSYARLIGSLSQVLSTDEAANILKTKILNKRRDESELKFAILSVNSFLKEAPAHVFDTGLLEEVTHLVIECCKSTVPYISDNATVAVGKLLLLQEETASPYQSSDLKSDKAFEIPDELVTSLVEQLSKSALQPESNSPDTRRLSLVVVRTVARFKYEGTIKPHWDVLVPSVFSCLRDGIIPIRLAAEKAYLAVFNLVDDAEQKDFAQWFEGASQGTISTILGATIQPRSIGDYTKRVASRLANVERERLEAGGDEETMFSDRFEDEKEVWAVGGV
ncbi:CIC11C00000000223 [Sungouiella intermedia]|uniref:eIF-2-alpha kinase activator GCN1 n=1 Tax=Sungouiella intermedia TaxID=45354 RepID=A0A1L0FXB8_9ASCO|nr:CIC11C00000000223 [[Candida] intermedia]